MASALDRRLRALEALVGSVEPLTLVVRFVASGGVLKPLETLSAMGGGSWRRLEGESEDDFVDRVSALVPVKRNCARVLIGRGSQL
jgi:hypothetical protein